MITQSDGWSSVNLSEKHRNQMVTPLVEYRREGQGYRVRYCFHDASMPADQQLGEWTEVAGEFWEVQAQLRAAGILTDDNQF